MSKTSKILITIFTFVAGVIIVAPKRSLNSAPPYSVSDTLSNSQLSFFTRLAAGNTAGDTLVRIATSGNPSNTTDNLFAGDLVGIGRSGLSGLDKFTVADIGNSATFQIDSGLSTGNAYAGNMAIATRSAIHTIKFTPQSNFTGGIWEFLIKATSRTGELRNDGIPDQEGFDLGADVGSTTVGLGTQLKAADVTCPWGATASVGTTAVVSGNTYHVITCSLGGGNTNPIDVEATLTIGRDLATGSQLINPAPSVDRAVSSEGVADVYTFYIRHRDASSVLVDADTVQGKIALVESVRVSATVDPTLTFTIDNTGVSTGNTICGRSMPAAAANTTATQVAFGSLSIGAFNDLAQRISCVTNSKSGYIVTVHESDTMRSLTVGSTATINDTDCDGACNTTTSAAWTTDNVNSGWGYSIENIGASEVAFDYGGGVNYNAKAFGIGSANAQMVMQNGGLPTTTESAYMCYRLVAGTTQEAGRYETQLVYTATAKF